MIRATGPNAEEVKDVSVSMIVYAYYVELRGPGSPLSSWKLVCHLNFIGIVETDQ